VRVAIGARPHQVEWMILRESLGLVACGIAIGVPVAIVLTRFVSALLFGLSPHDPATIAGVLAVMLVATMLAAYLPARRAARLDPIVALRVD
jgi:putative ABC transport system permease protein